MENKKRKIKKLRWLPILITSCLILSVVSAPVTIFADEGTEGIENRPSGVGVEYSYNHTYHTNVKITANVTIQDEDGNTTSQIVEEESGYIKGKVSDENIQNQIAQYNTVIKDQFRSKGTITATNTKTKTILDHFESKNFYKLTGTDGNTVFEEHEADWVRAYFSRYPNATGTLIQTLDVHEYQVYEMTYDLIVGNGQSGAISKDITESKKNSSDAPVHIHSFSWVTVTEPSVGVDGLEEYRCSCGLVEQSQGIPGSQFYVKDMFGNIKDAPANGTVEYDAGPWHTISDYVLKKMAERPDVAVTVRFTYKGKNYQITFPAGTDYIAVLNDEDIMYGYFGVAEKLGLIVTELD